MHIYVNIYMHRHASSLLFSLLEWLVGSPHTALLCGLFTASLNQAPPGGR